MTDKVHVKKLDEELQILWAEVYAPDVPDSHGDYMKAEEIRKMAYDFVMKGRLDQVDVNHDNKLYGCHIVESFITRDNDPIFIKDSWVVAIYIPDAVLWGKVKSGELNGLSMEVFAHKEQVELDMRFPVLVVGKTKEVNGHSHSYEVYFDENGLLVGGKTDTVESHFHLIRGGTTTEVENDHHHMYDVVEKILELNNKNDQDKG